VSIFSQRLPLHLLESDYYLSSCRICQQIDSLLSSDSLSSLISSCCVASLFVVVSCPIQNRIAISVVYHLPTIQRITIETLETIFAIKTLMKQMILVVTLETGSIALGQVVSSLQTIFIRIFSVDYRLICHLKNRMEQQRQQRHQVSSSSSPSSPHQLSHDEWMDLAERIDIIQGHDVWRSDPNSPYYERHRLEARSDEYIRLMRRRDIVGLMYILRGSGIGRNKFGLLQKGLFTKAMAGTKVIVER
jgi:TAG lipase/steryl ester hydrolase/phospholipase A2/LPA acyltransferase